MRPLSDFAFGLPMKNSVLALERPYIFMIMQVVVPWA
jgi:hypothetical protein